MEDLTKHQIILLCLLLSFVTSIGTGVITFSLLSEAPPGVTQTINRVVEKTIERIVPTETNANVHKVMVKETVVVKEEELIVTAIEKNTGLVVQIKGSVLPEAESSFYGLGFIATKEGLIVAPADLVVEAASYSGQFADGQVVRLIKSYMSEDKRLVFFIPESTPTTRQTFTPVSFSDSDALKLGQGTIVLSGTESRVASLGRITGLRKLPHATTTSILNLEPNTVALIEVDTVAKERIKGEVLLNLSGAVVGVATSDQDSFSFIPSNDLKKEIEIYSKKPQNKSL